MIQRKGVDSDGKRLILLKSRYPAKPNEKRSHVSVLRPGRGEFTRLYSVEPQKLQNTIEKVIHR